MIDEKRLDEIQKRREAIGEAIWVATKMTSHKSRSHGKEYFKVVDKDFTLDQIAHYIPTLKIADFIASAKDDITYLLDVIADLQSQLAEIKNDVLPIPPSGIGDVSDGYHTFNELYHHRAVLFGVICKQNSHLAWKSRLHADGTMFDDMFIVGINTPTGQATYHYNIEPYWDMFKVTELERAPEWDGHTSAQAIERIKDMAITAKDLHEQLAEANRRADAAIKEMKLIVDAVREEHCDDTCCFACMFDCDTSITWTGDHANECPGFELNDCFLWRGAEKGAVR